jgi:predicted GNAT family N-acyltransferase
MQTKLDIRRFDQLSAEEYAVISRWLSVVFANSDYGYQWAEPDWCVQLFDAHKRELISYLKIVEREARVGESVAVKLAGIGDVMTRDEWRGRGYAEQLMRHAANFICDQIKADFGLLICKQHHVLYYRKLGWREVKGPLVFDQPSGKVAFKHVTMVLPCQSRKWPEGVIDLCGLPW